MDVLDWIEKANKFDSRDFLTNWSYVIIDSEKIVDLQREQWGEGQDYKGQIIGIYKESTEELSGGRKKAGDPYNLLDSGDFWGNTFLMVLVKGDDVEFLYDSRGVHKDELFDTIRRHGEIMNPDDIFGLYEPFQDKMIKLLEPLFINQLEKYYSDGM